MTKFLERSLLLSLLFALICLPSLRAQTTDIAPAANAAASSAPSGQAPDEMTKKISDLVHAGNYAEAQQLTNGLLAAYPDDQRLIKAKALIEKLSAAPVASANQPAPPASAADQLTGMDKVDYSALIVLARQAQATTDLPEQTKQLQQFMDQSAVFLQKHPDQMQLWQLRAASAIILDDPMAGYEAGQKLLAAGAADSNDPNLQTLLGQLKNKGWLDEQPAKSYAAAADIAAVIDTPLGHITCTLFEKEAPNTVANFIGLAEGTKDWVDPVTHHTMHGKSMYNGTTFHRVVPGFMIQGGDPTGTGSEGPGYAFNDEFDPNLNFDVPGRLAMANTGPNSNGSQFFITEVAAPSLDQHYTIFGQCDEHSIAVVMAIARWSTTSADGKPHTAVVINKVTILHKGRADNPSL